MKTYTSMIDINISILFKELTLEYSKLFSRWMLSGLSSKSDLLCKLKFWSHKSDISLSFEFCQCSVFQVVAC